MRSRRRSSRPRRSSHSSRPTGIRSTAPRAPCCSPRSRAAARCWASPPPACRWLRRCCSRQASLIQEAHAPRLLKYQSASRSAICRTSQAIEVRSQPAVLITNIRQRGRLPVAVQRESQSARLRHSASSSTAIQSGRNPYVPWASAARTRSVEPVAVTVISRRVTLTSDARRGDRANLPATSWCSSPA